MALAPRLALCLLLAALCLLPAQGMSITSDCCHASRDVPLSRNWLPRIKGYYIQDEHIGCSYKAFVLITRRNHRLCYPLNSKTVARLRELLDNRRPQTKGKTLHKSKKEPSRD